MGLKRMSAESRCAVAKPSIPIAIEGHDVKIFTDNIEENALEQIKELLSIDVFSNKKIRIMPDVHAGAGCVIGFTGDLGDKVIPNIVGVDIGCGMRILNLGKLSEIDFHAFNEHIRGNVPSGMIVREDRFGFKPLVGEEMEIYREAKQLVTELYCYREIKDSGRINKAIGSLGGGNHFLQPVGFKVAQADGADLALCHGFLHILPRAHVIAHLLVEQKQVNIADVQTGQHFVDALHGFALAVLAGPQLGSHPNLLTGDAALLDGLTHAALILVSVGGVDVAVAQLQRLQAGVLGFITGRDHENAHTKLGNFRTVVQCNISLVHFNFSLISHGF